MVFSRFGENFKPLVINVCGRLFFQLYFRQRASFFSVGRIFFFVHFFTEVHKFKGTSYPQGSIILKPHFARTQGLLFFATWPIKPYFYFTQSDHTAPYPWQLQVFFIFFLASWNFLLDYKTLYFIRISRG